MFVPVFLAFAGFCSATDVFYHADQSGATLTVEPGNPYVSLTSSGGEDYPTKIVYLRNITRETGLMIRVLFGNSEGPMDAARAQSNILNLCDILQLAMTKRTSHRVQYRMAESLGLYGTLCPVAKGTKPISPYFFPAEFAARHLPSGDLYYKMRMETRGQKLEQVAVMELKADIIVTDVIEACTSSSGTVSSVPSIVTGTAIALFIAKYNI